MTKFVKVAALALAMLICVAGLASASSIAVNNAAAMNATTFGMQTNMTAAATDAYVRSDHPVSETHYLMRFWVNPSGLPLAEGAAGTNSIRFFRLNDQNDGGDPQPRGTFLVGFFTKSPDDHQYHMIFWAKQNGTTAFTSIGNLFIGSGASQIEVEFTAANSGTTSVVMKKLSTAQSITRNNLNLSDADVDLIDIGSFTNSNPSAINGNYFFDEFESYR
ncbi:MAG: hypothetical protein ABI639_04640 [Thermoanaerobaculia bacterium]